MKVSFKDNAPDLAPCRCANCQLLFVIEELDDIDDVGERLDPGGEVPAGQCPECGALAYLIRVET